MVLLDLFYERQYSDRVNRSLLLSELLLALSELQVEGLAALNAASLA
jgi:hypothetical protein